MNGSFNVREASSLTLKELKHYMDCGLVNDVGNRFTGLLVQQAIFELEELENRRLNEADQAEDGRRTNDALVSEAEDKLTAANREIEDLKKQLSVKDSAITNLRRGLFEIQSQASAALQHSDSTGVNK